MQRTIMTAMGLALTLSFMGTASIAQAGAVYVEPATGYYDFDDSRNSQDEQIKQLSLGYQTSGPWAFEVFYQRSDTRQRVGGAGIEWPMTAAAQRPVKASVDWEQAGVNALYYFNRCRRVQPYLVAGAAAGQTEVGSLEADETLLNFGVGLKVDVSNRFAVKADARAFNSLDENHVEVGYTVGLNYRFGDATPATCKPARSAQPVAAAATPTAPVTEPAQPVASAPAAAPEPAPAREPGDQDNDGVPDNRDRCPDTAAGVTVDAEGCGSPTEGTVTVNVRVLFDSNSSIIRSEQEGDIRKVARLLSEYPDATAVIEGHCDNTGEAKYNQWLSQRRADAVARVLVQQHGVSASRLRAVGYGESRPIATNDTAAGRQKNRRVNAVISNR